jgi:hypothetical protein
LHPTPLSNKGWEHRPDDDALQKRSRYPEGIVDTHREEEEGRRRSRIYSYSMIEIL